MENYILATIVTYNPDLIKLQKNLIALRENVEELVVVDNGSDNIANIIKEVASCFHGLKYSIIKNNINEGIASALNKATHYATISGYHWLLTLDQDSICGANYTKAMLEVISDDVGIVYPLLKNTNRIETPTKIIMCDAVLSWGKKNFFNVNKKNRIVMPITSGALMNVKALNKVGGYDERIFIDGVDFDIDLKLQKTGYILYQCAQAVLFHNLGYPKSGRFLIFNITASGHSPLRVYYMNRNAILLFRRYYNFAFQWCVTNILQTFTCALKNALVSREYSKYMIALFNGLYDGIKNDLNLK